MEGVSKLRARPRLEDGQSSVNISLRVPSKVDDALYRQAR
jgi:hypothetical protein